MRNVRSVVGVMVILFGVGAGQAFAQSNDEVFPQFQWNFGTPGARANAMGRAFIGVADDASASITNPAGLVRLTRPQGYFEFKSTKIEVDRLAETRSLFSLEPFTTSKTVGSPAFFSVSFPVGEKLAVAFTRHEFLNYQEDFELDARPIPTTENIFFPVDGSSEFKGVTWAGSVAFKVNPKFLVGATIGFDQISGVSEATRFDFNILDPDDTSQFNVSKSDIIVNQTSIDDSATGISFVAGALFLPNDKVTIGVQFAKGSSTTIEENLQINPSSIANLPLETATGFPKDVTINVPTRFGAGVSFRPTPKLLASFDFVHIGYNSLVKDFTLILDAETLANIDVSIDNVIETHVGGEYLLVDSGTTRLFVRGGFYTAPDHSVKFNGGVTDPVAIAAQDAIYNLLPLDRTTPMVGTFGVGLVAGPRFQADFAYVWNREVVVSVAVRFK